MSTTDDVRATLDRCATPDCTRPSDLVAAIQVLAPDGSPFPLGVAAFCDGHQDAEPRATYPELVHQAHQDPDTPLWQTLADRWPAPILLTRGQPRSGS